ncbi:MAG: GGDEF domain-containing protein [Rhodoferax sp.]|jgi:diguanylate cyclase (GGDEF)-like protein
MGQIDATLRLVMLIVAGIYAISWLALGITFRTYPKAIASFFLSNLGIGWGTYLVTQRAINPGFVSFQIADWLAIGGIAACRAGVVFLVKAQPKPLGLVIPLIAEIFATIFVAPDESSYFYRAIVFNAIAAWIAIASFIDCMKGPSQEQLALPVKLVIAWPLIASGILFGTRTAQVLSQSFSGSHVSFQTQGNYVTFLWAFIIVLLTINIAMVGLVVSRLLQKIRVLADIDPLTACLNRRAFNVNLAIEIDRYKRSQLPLACALIDLDHFKEINDQFGHNAGDLALIHAVTVIKGSIRSIDVLGRHGGEEFVLLMPDTSLTAAADAAERIRVALAEKHFMFEGQSVGLTASFGVSVFHTDETGDDFIRRADNAMYEAKRLGRNRTKLAMPITA